MNDNAKIDTSTEAVERLLEDVTPGPWQVDGPSWNQIIWSSNGNRVCFMAHSNGLNVVSDLAAASFIAAARDLVPTLLAERDDLRAKLAEMQAKHDAVEEARDMMGRLWDQEKTRADRAEAAKVAALVEVADELIEAYSAIFRLGNPWGDKLRAALRAIKETAK